MPDKFDLNRLTDKQRRFCEEYMVDNNGTQAAIRAGFAKESAKQTAHRFKKHKVVQEYIEYLMDQAARRNDVSVDYVLSNLKEVAQRCLQAEPVLDREGNHTGEYRFDSSGANKALELIGKHLKMFTDKVEATGKDGGPLYSELTDEQVNARINELLKQSGITGIIGITEKAS